MNNDFSILKHFISITDPRKNINIKHKLIDIITITICAVICGAEGWEDIEMFGQSKFEWFKTFLELPNGIPSHDRFRAVFVYLDPYEFEKSFQSWINCIRKKVEGDIISIDGKTCCGSHDRKNGGKAIHMVSAWSKKNKLVLGQVKTEEKSNEITAIPELLQTLAIEGCIVTIDAMGCQKNIVKKIIDKEANYIIAVKDNQKNLHNKIKKIFLNESDTIACNVYKEEEKNSHGRAEKREYFVLSIPEHWKEKKEWKELNSIGMVKSERLLDGKYTKEYRYYITSLEENRVKKISEGIRSHWGIENSLHWQLDVSFNEDACRKRSENAAQNFSLLRKIALNLLKNEKSKKVGVKSKGKLCGWDRDYLLKVLFSK